MTAQGIISKGAQPAHLPVALLRAFEGWDGNLGAIDGRDATFLYNLIRTLRPETLVELGTASGFSSALIALMLAAEDLGQAHLASYDLAARFFLDKSKPLGFLIKDIAGPAAAAVQLHPGHTSLSAAPLYADKSIDLAFIDANHRHPWPLIDAFMFLPKMAEGGVMVFHDPMAIRLPTNKLGIGPKVVLDSAPRDVVIPTRALLPESDITAPTRWITDNIFGIVCSADRMRIATDLSDGFLTPWTVSNQIDLKTIMQISQRLAAAYPEHVSEAFRWAAERHYARSWA